VKSVALHDVGFDRNRGTSQLIKGRPMLRTVQVFGDAMSKESCGVGVLPSMERTVAIHAMTLCSDQ